jgi:hypothetical protein
MIGKEQGSYSKNKESVIKALTEVLMKAAKKTDWNKIYEGYIKSNYTEEARKYKYSDAEIS